MLLSERELGLSDAHEALSTFRPMRRSAPPTLHYAGLDDPVIDVAVTPNRPDALGIYGIARDLAAKEIGRLKPLDAEIVEGSLKSLIAVELRFESPDNRPCPLSSAAISAVSRTEPRPRGCSSGSAPLAFGLSQRWST